MSTGWLDFAMKKFLFDILVLLNILQGGLSIIPLMAVNHIGVNYLITTFLNIAYVLAFSRKIIAMPLSKYSLPIYLYLLMIFTNLLKFDRIEFSLAVILNQVSFLVLLQSFALTEKNALKSLLSPYLIYSGYNVLAIILLYVFIVFFSIDPYQNVSNAYLFTKDAEVAYFPYYLSIFRPDDTIRLALFYSGGMICGLSHEPHVVAYICMHAFFILYKTISNKNKIYLSIIYVLFVLITFSATTVISFGVILSLLLLSNFHDREKLFKVFLMFILILALGIYVLHHVDLSFLVGKITSDGGSRDYSIDRLLYVLTPSTILGTTIFTTDINGDVGLITCILNIMFYISFVYLVMKLWCSISRYKYIAFALGYLFLHSMKIVLLIYSYPFVLYMLFVLYAGLKLSVSEKAYNKMTV